MTAIGEQLRQARQAKGWSLNAVGKMLSINPYYLGTIERGERLPQWATVTKLTTAYGFEVTLVAKESEEAK